jgi:DNA-binding NtrC family response regulator/tetratricopeptide (TPR) repeat protein/serine/threonine protein kinase
MLSIEPDTVLVGRYVVIDELQADKESSILLVRDLQHDDQPERHLTLSNKARFDPAFHSFSTLDIATIKSLRYPHFLRVYDGGELKRVKNLNYLVTDKAQGIPLLEWVQNKDPSVEAWTTVLCDVLKALSFLHNQGWIHLCLSESMVRVHEGRGIVTHYGSLSHEFEFSESWRADLSKYSAPELKGGCPLDRRADFYSVGVMLYRLVTGSLPVKEKPTHVGPSKRTVFRLSIPHSPLATVYSTLLHKLLSDEPSMRMRCSSRIIGELRALSGMEIAGQEAKRMVLVPQFLGRRTELANLNSAVSFLIEGMDFPEGGEGLLLARRSTRLIVRSPSSLKNASNDAWISIHGERGIGKTRLVGEFAHRLQDKGVDCVWLCGRGLQRAVFDPITQIIERLLDRAGAQRRSVEAPESIRRELLRFLPSLVTKIPPPASRAEDADEFSAIQDMRGERDRIIDGLASFMIREARAKPYILVVTDFDALSEFAQNLIVHLARRVGTSRRWQERMAVKASAMSEAGPIPLFIVTTSESMPKDDGTQFEDGHQVLSLAPLRQWEISRLIIGSLGVDCVEEKTVAWLNMLVEGHPGRLLDRLHDYLNVFEEKDGSWALPAAVFKDLEALVPALKDLKRVKTMAIEGRMALAVFGCLDRPISSELLLSSIDCESEAGLSAVRHLLSLRLITRRADQRMLLSNPYLGREARQSLDEEQRATLDKRVMQSLAEQFEKSSREDQLIELAEFAIRIEDVARLKVYAVDAAGSYERIHADSRALELYQAVLESGQIDPVEALTLRVRMAACLFRTEDVVGAIAEFRGLIAETPEHWPTAPRVAIARRLAVILASEGRDEEAFEAFEDGERIVEAAEAPDVETVREFAALLSDKADFLLIRTEAVDQVAKICERAQRALRENAATGKGRDLALVRARLLALQGQLEFLNDRYDSAEQLTRGALAVQERYGAVLQAARSYYRLGNIELSRQREGVAEKHWHKSLKIRRDFGDRYGVAHILANLSLSAARLGRMEKAQDFILQSLRIREESGDVRGRAAALHNLGYIYASSGNMQRAVASYNECLALREELNDVHYAARVQNNLAKCLFVLGETMEARDRLVSALLTLREDDDKRGQATALARLAEIDFHRGRFTKAVQRARDAQKIRDEIGAVEDIIDTLQVNATIEVGLGRHTVARSLIHEACELARSGHFQVQLARSLLLYGRILSHLGEYDAAKSSLLESQRLYEGIGDTRALRCVAMEIATVYIGVGLHSDANYLISPKLIGIGDHTADELGHGYEKIRELHIQALLQLVNREGDAEHAKSCALEALELSVQSQLVTQQWRSLRLASAASEALGDSNEAQDFAAEAQEIVEDLASELADDRRDEYLSKAAVKAAIHGDPSLASLRRRYIRRRTENPEPAVSKVKKLGVTITRPPVSQIPSQPQRTNPRRTVHIKRLRTRPSTTSVAKGAKTSSDVDASLRNAELATIIRLNRKILARGSKKKLLTSCLIAAVKLTRAERGFLGIEGSEGSLDIVCAQNMNREDVRLAKNAFSLRMAERCIAVGQMIASSDAAHDPLLRRHSSLLGIGVRSVLAIPFRSTMVRGVIYLDHRFQRGAFDSHQMNLAQGLADQAGLVFELADSPKSSSEALKLPHSDLTADLSAEKVYRLEPFMGTSEFMETLYSQSPAWAKSKEPMLIVGEAAVGKQTLAETLHKLGPRSREPLVVLDCRTVPDDLAEVELFGRVAGAYEGATERKGLLRAAASGTLIIVGLWHATELVRSRLATALRSQQVRPVGSDEAEELDARIVTLAPNIGLHKLRGSLSKSLFNLVSESVVTIPPLRERIEDIAFIVQSMLMQLSAESEVPLKSFEKEALQRLMSHSWFGNYRELRSVVRKTWKSSGGNEVIRLADLPALEELEESEESEELTVYKEEATNVFNLEELVRTSQRELILKVLDLTKDREEAAELLGIPRRKLNKLIKKLNLDG